MMPDVNVRRKYIQTQPFEKCVGKMDKNEFTSKWAQSKVKTTLLYIFLPIKICIP